MSKKCLIIAPHPDDEICLAGCIFDQLKSVDVTVAFCTNGDYIATNADVRIKEALKAKEQLGYNNIIILGYGDNCNGIHIYEAVNNEIVSSHAGRRGTLDAGGLKTFHLLKHGCQCAYTRENLKNDIKELILEVNANIIICVDTDNHPDHRAISLLFDEVIGELLKVQNFHPIILKKFSYVGTYFGIDDYFNKTMMETLPSYENLVDTSFSFPYNWDDRLCFQNFKNNHPLAFWKSSIFKSLLCHKSQNAYVNFVKLCNDDVVYWYRSTQSLTYLAKIRVSSGDASYLNDFKIIDTDDIKSDSVTIQPSHTKAWIPSRSDNKREVHFSFVKAVNVSYLVIYQAPFSNIYRIGININVDKSNTYYFDCGKTNIIKIKMPILQNIKYLGMSFFTNNLEDRIVIYEIEIYETKPFFPWKNVPFTIYNPDENKTERNSFSLKMYSYLFECYHQYRSCFLQTLRSYRWRFLYKINSILKRITTH